MSHQPKYINREISWLKFNARVLQEAADVSVPLLERLRFLGIYSNNLDEFYKVRYASLVRAINLKSKSFQNILEHQTPIELLEEINKVVAQQSKNYDKLFNEIVKALEKENIKIVNENQLLDAHKHFIDEYFYNKLSHTINVFYWQEGKKVPALRDGAFYLLTKIKKRNFKTRYALVEIPTTIFPRFIVLPQVNNIEYVIFLEDIVRYHLKEIFRIFSPDFVESHSIKITRDAELSIDNDLEMSFLKNVSESLDERKKGEPVRLVYDKNISKDALHFLKTMLRLDDYDSLSAGGKYHNKRDFMNFPTLGRKDLEYEKLRPFTPNTLNEFPDYFKVFSKENFLMYQPYHDYAIFLKFLRNAAIDPKVKSIKITIYRVADDSQVMSALINAAKNGKEVTAVLELRARFDEAQNIVWTKQLQDEGVKVIFGVPGLKVHSKVGLIEREPQRGYAEKYAFISTGNFHEGTARVYTDFMQFTANKDIVNEIENLFEFFSANYLVKSYNYLWISPFSTRKKLIKCINKEIKNHKNGLPAQINIKVNSFSDKEIIDKLYEASEAGVEVRLIVRGICSLIAGKKPFSENIKVVSVIDRFLEHPRMYWFKNGGEDKIYISSADIMPRNLDHRIEISVPIITHKNKRIAKAVFELGFNDNVKARIVQEGFEEPYQINKKQKNRSQERIYKFLLNI